MRVQYKLFAITLLASFVLVASMLALAQWSFDRGLLEHVNKRALQQYQSLSEQLALHYQQQGDWLQLSIKKQKGNGQVNAKVHYNWLQLQQDSGLDVDPIEVQRAQQKANDRKRYPREPREHFSRNAISENERPPHHERPRNNDLNRDRPDFERREPPRDRPFPPPRRQEERQQQDSGFKKRPLVNKSPLALLDVNKELVIGFLPRPDQRNYLPIYLKEDQVIGYVVYANRDRLIDDYDLDLSSQLSNNLWWIAGLMIILSASLALPFSRLLLRPLRPIVESLHTLAKGDFSGRIKAVNQDEIGRIAEDINHLAQQLEEIDVSRKTWLANISHELRTPLAVMRGDLEAMLDGIRELNKDNLSSAHQEALHLQRLVEDLYQLTSGELGNNNVAAMSYHKQELDFSALIEDELQRFTPLLAKAGLNFTFINHIEQQDEEAWVNGDTSRLSQLIHNLMNNSIKYTHSPGILVADLALENDVIIFTLMDSAPNVKGSELEKLFNHLYRAEQSRNRKTGGSGLGLALSKQIAQSHDGELTASLSELGGIKMTLCLPCC